MATTSFLTEEDQEILLPDEDIMLEREGRDRRGIRRELAPTTEMERGTRYVEEGDGVYADAKSSMPTSDTSVGEVLGNVDIVRYTGEQVRIPRMTHGMTVDAEELNVDGAQEKVMRAQDVVMEQFDIQADLQFLLGITDEEGNTVQPDIFTWLDNNIPAGNVIDGSAKTYDVPANAIVREAYSKTSGEYADDGWDFAIWDHSTRALWNEIDNNSGVMQASQWLDLGSDAQNVGQSLVNDTVLMPDSIGLRTPPDQPDSLQFDISTMPSDTMYLIPDHGGDFFEMYEQPEPTLIDEPIRKNGGKLEYEYYWRAGHAFGFGSHRTDDGAGGDIARDVVRIDNVSDLF
jgi:hypothetical protein